MIYKEYSIVIWSESDDRGMANEIWSGQNLKKAILIAAVQYTKSSLEYYCRITVIKNIDPELEVKGQLPQILKSFGDENILFFKRVHSLS